VLAAGLGALALVAAGCGGPAAPPVAGIGTRTTSTAPTVAGCSRTGCSSAGASQRLEAQALKYSECMRAHGLADFPDPTLGPNGLPGFSMNDSGDLNAQSPQFQAAKDACKNDLPDLGAPPTRQDEVGAALEYTRCMRSHGEPDFPDPDGRGVIRITSTTGILAPSSPQFRKAQAACQSLDAGFGEEGVSASPTAGGSGS
jgi:hypothetical protein